MLLRFDPFREFDRLTDQVLGNPRMAMAMDAYRHGDEFVVHFDLPGVDPGSIDLTVERNVLTVSAAREWRHDNGVEVIASERPQGRFSRQLFLGDSLDTERINASYDNGVLTLRLPVAEQAKPRKVEVTSGGGGTATPIETTSSAA